jgi:eukaryotic-like serine/threonine-protein kinase
VDRDRSTTGPHEGIGPYRIERELGRGGMGIVYLGRDSRLDRPVALKALPEELARDGERLARFEREAKILASLNHPNIASIYGIEEAAGRRFLALEYVDGETLADRIARGPLPLDDTIEIGIQLAAGMEAAHESSVIHRDLKPANIMLGRGEAVKILDFGLAKGRVATESDIDLGDSPTIAGSPPGASAMTMPGVILGTAAYLSPEQAKGRPVDRRTDIWSFGCTLYECLTGKHAIHAETAAETLARILEHDPDWTALPARTPPAFRQLLQNCLEKDPRRRLRDVGDARIALEEIRSAVAASRSALAHGLPAEGAAAERVARRARTGLLLLAAVLGAVVGIALWSAFGPRRGGTGEFRGVARLSIELPPGLEVVTAQLSPDGRVLAMVAHPPASSGLAPGGGSAVGGAETPPNQLYLRPLDGRDFVAVAGTEGATGLFAFSPDSRWIAYLVPVTPGGVDLRLMKVATTGGSAPPVEIMPWRPGWDGVIWPTAGELVTQADGRSLVRIPAAGGTPSEPVAYQYPESTLSVFPLSALPGGMSAFVALQLYQESAWRSGAGILELRTGQLKILLRDGGNPQLASTGHVVFTRSEALLAAPFDTRRLELSGPPVAIMDGLRTRSSWQPAQFGLGSDGTLLFAPGGVVSRDRRAVIIDAKGNVTDWSGERKEYSYGVAVSPDGLHMAAPVINAKLLTDLRLSDRGSPTSRLAVSVPGADLAEPVWSPDGRRLAFTLSELTERDGVYVEDVNGAGPPRAVYLPRTRFPVPATPTSWSPDGSTLLVNHLGPGNSDVIAVSLDARVPADSLPPAKPVLAGHAFQIGAVFSPDGRHIAYASDESGRQEVYVSRWDPDGSLGPPLAVSVGGGAQPQWSPDGRVLYYVAPASLLMSVSLAVQPELSASPPRLAWDLDAWHVGTSQLFGQRLIDVLPDGRLLAIQEGPGEGDLTRLDVVLNFLDELRGGARRR